MQVAAKSTGLFFSGVICLDTKKYALLNKLRVVIKDNLSNSDQNKKKTQSFLSVVSCGLWAVQGSLTGEAAAKGFQATGGKCTEQANREHPGGVWAS